MFFHAVSHRVALVFALVLTLTLCVPAHAEQMTVYAAVDDAIVYDIDGNCVATVPLNTALTLTGMKRGVCRVTLNGYIAYMNKSELSASPVVPQTDTGTESTDVSAYVKNRGANLYDEQKQVIATLGLNVVVTVKAKKGSVCQVNAGEKTGYMYVSDLSLQKVQTEDDGASVTDLTPVHGPAREMDWWTSDIQKIFARGVVAQITDVETGLTWRERRNGGNNHADCQPLTPADTAAMKKAYGGKWSWDRRAVFVTINGVNYAASINGMPHGDGSIKGNDFPGHHCIHFTNSRTHASNKVCPLHQAAIKKAALATM